MTKITLEPGTLNLATIKKIIFHENSISLKKTAYQKINAAQKILKNIVDEGRVVYGINTGFGSLANTRISAEELTTLQNNLILSHAAGTGPLFNDEIIRLILLLKINMLSCGFSGIRKEVVDFLLTLFNHQIYPCIPSKGSVGACGDLAPLAHMACALIGVGDVHFQAKTLPARKVLTKLGLSPLKLGPKEGLALINGTQASTAVALSALFKIENVFKAALVGGALAVDAAMGAHTPFDERLQLIRRQCGSLKIAAVYRDLLKNSEIARSHFDCDKVQDPYSLRCQPQVMGACYDQIQYAADLLEREANAISDNPIVFTETAEILSGGNFHAETVAMAADSIAIAVAEIGSLAERIIALLIDTRSSGLPPFLVENSGVNSGFMMAHVTAAALASENKSLAHPASVDNIPTSAYQEDHVSMAMFAANRLLTMVENTAAIVGIEILAACQGIDFRAPLKTSRKLQTVIEFVRQHVPFYDRDRLFSKDIDIIKSAVISGQFNRFVKLSITD